MQKSKLLEIAIAILGAVLLWVFVVTEITPDDNITISGIPVVFQGENELRNEHNLIISNKTTTTVTVKFHGTRADLKRLERNSRDITAVLDVDQFASERDYSAGYEVIYPSAILDNNVQVVDRNPRTVQFTVEQLESKQIPVRGVFDGTLKDGYVQGDLLFDQDTVKVTGPAALVEQVKYAQVILDGNNISQTFTEKVNISLFDMNDEPLRSNDLAISTQEIEVTLPVLLEVTLPLRVTPVYAAGATAENTAVSVSPEEVTLRGPESVLLELTEVSLGELDLSLVLDEHPVPMEIPLPDGVEIVSREKNAEVSTVFTGLEHLDLEVTKLRPENLASDMSAKIMDKSLAVTLRGPSELLIDFDESELVAVVNLGEYSEAGSFTVPVTIETGSNTVGAIGQYSVTVELTKHATEQ